MCKVFQFKFTDTGISKDASKQILQETKHRFVKCLM